MGLLGTRDNVGWRILILVSSLKSLSDYCAQNFLSSCSSPIRSLSAWLCTYWQIWLCEDCSEAMTQRSLRTIEVDQHYACVYIRLCCDCWNSRGRPSYAKIIGAPPRATHGVSTIPLVLFPDIVACVIISATLCVSVY